MLEEVKHQVAAEYLPVMAVIREQLLEELSGIERAEVLCNEAFFVCLHGTCIIPVWYMFI